MHCAASDTALPPHNRHNDAVVLICMHMEHILGSLSVTPDPPESVLASPGHALTSDFSLLL